jgi:hypothetical protein
MKTIFLGALLLITIIANAQNDTTWYFGINGRAANDSLYEMKKVVNNVSKNKITIETYKFGQDKKLSTEIYTKDEENIYDVSIKEGKNFTASYTRKYKPVSDNLYEFTDIVNDVVKRTGTTHCQFPLFFEGTVTEYYKNGKKMSESVYSNNELVSNRNWKEEGEEVFDNVFYSVDKLPFFKKGNDALHKHILKTLKDSQVETAKVSGNMLVGFIVFENGSIGGFKVLKGVNSQLNGVVVQALKTLGGEWEPARLNGKTVRYFQQFPINFISQDKDLNYFEFDGSSIHWDK